MDLKKEIGKLFNNALGIAILIISGIIAKVFYDSVSPKEGGIGGFLLLLLSFFVFFFSIIIIHLFINYFLKFLVKVSEILSKFKKKKSFSKFSGINNTKMLVENSDENIQNSIKHCEECGAENSINANFCQKCGNKVNL